MEAKVGDFSGLPLVVSVVLTECVCAENKGCTCVSPPPQGTGRGMRPTSGKPQ